MNFANSQDDVSMFAHFAYYDEGNFVFNGIAYEPETNTFLLTGKMWNHIYRVKMDYAKFIDPKYKVQS